MTSVTIHSDFGAHVNNSSQFPYFPISLLKRNGTRYHDLRFWSSKPAFSLFSFTYIKKLSSFSLLSGIQVMSFACQRFFTFLPAILIPDSNSPSLAFHMMFFACILKKQNDIVQPWHNPFLVLNHCSMSGSNCCFLTCIHISQEAGKVVWYSYLFRNFP